MSVGKGEMPTASRNKLTTVVLFCEFRLHTDDSTGVIQHGVN